VSGTFISPAPAPNSMNPGSRAVQLTELFDQLLSEISKPPAPWTGRVSLTGLFDGLADAVGAGARIWGRTTGMRDEVRLSAPVICPSCGREVAGRWLAGRETAAQQCRGCTHTFTAPWPGWEFSP
jgi:hypothetical protein